MHLIAFESTRVTLDLSCMWCGWRAETCKTQASWPSIAASIRGVSFRLVVAASGSAPDVASKEHKSMPTLSVSAYLSVHLGVRVRVCV